MEVTMNHIGMSREMETALYLLMHLLGYKEREDAMSDQVLARFVRKSGLPNQMDGTLTRLPRFDDLLKLRTIKDESIDPAMIAIAAELRYVLAVDDNGKKLQLIDDPIIKDMQRILSSVEFGKKGSYCGQLKALLRNPLVFGLDLYEYGIASGIEKLFIDMIAGPGAIRKTLMRYL